MTKQPCSERSSSAGGVGDGGAAMRAKTRPRSSQPSHPHTDLSSSCARRASSAQYDPSPHQPLKAVAMVARQLNRETRCSCAVLCQGRELSSQVGRRLIPLQSALLSQLVNLLACLQKCRLHILCRLGRRLEKEQPILLRKRLALLA